MSGRISRKLVWGSERGTSTPAQAVVLAKHSGAASAFSPIRLSERPRLSPHSSECAGRPLSAALFQHLTCEFRKISQSKHRRKFSC